MQRSVIRESTPAPNAFPAFRWRFMRATCFELKGSATQVTWTMRGPVPYISKIIHLFFDIDRMVGADFEAGLASLKAIAEK